MARWYIIHAYSGFENKVRDSIISEAERMGLSQLVEAVEVPSETVTEVKRGKKVQVERKTMPGYVLAKLAMNDDLLFVAVEDGAVIGSIMAGYDGHRGWLYSVAVRQSAKRRGVGTALVQRAEAALRALGCPKINLQVRSTNAAVIAFYQRLGFAVEDHISMGRLL